MATALVAGPAGGLATSAPATASSTAPATVPVSTPNDANGSSGRGPQRSAAALRLIDPMSAGPGLSAQPACNWAPGRAAHAGVPAMCVHADAPPAGVDVTHAVDTDELRGRPGATAAADLAARAVTSAATATTASGVAPPLTTPAATSTVQCYGNGTDGNRVQAIYAVERGRTNRYASLVGSIRVWSAGVDAVVNRSAAAYGGSRHVRFVTAASGGVCTPTVLNVTLPAGSTADFDATMNALDALGYTNPHRKYLVWVDASVLCGIASVYQDSSSTAASNWNNGLAPQYARIDAPCWGYSDSVEAHELVHTLGSVQPDAPHHTLYGHCYDEYDRMCYDDGSGIAMQSICPSDWDALLDCHGDDYFNPRPTPGGYLATHWNTASSAFLSSSTALRVALSAGTVVPGLPSTVTANVTLAAGRTLRSLTFSSSSSHCAVTRTGTRTGRLLCSAVLPAAPTLRVVAVDSTGLRSTTTVVPTLDAATRPATLQLTVGGETVGADAWCDATGTLRARLVDDATGVAVAGVTATFTRSDTAGGSRTTLGQAVSGSTGIALLRTPLLPVYLHADTAAAGPWQAAAASTGQDLTIAGCTGVATAALSRTTVRYGDPVTVSGTLKGDAGGHLVPLPGRTVTVQLRRGASSTLLGRATTTDTGGWVLRTRASLSGALVASTTATAGVSADTATTPTLTVSPWATTVTAAAARIRVDGALRYRVTGRAVRTAQPSAGVPAATVEVWYRPPGGSSRRVATTASNGTGRFSAVIPASRGGSVRVKLRARVGYLSARSASVRLL